MNLSLMRGFAPKRTRNPREKSAFVSPYLKSEHAAITLLSRDCGMLGASKAGEHGITEAELMGQAMPRIMKPDCFEDGPEAVCAGLTRTIATVMFTDLEDSTGLARTLGVTGIAVFLKRHLSLVRGVIESHDGTVLGHTGDGVFAFWDSATPQSGDAALLALSAAAELAESITESNCRRCALGLPVRRIRVGLNSGEVALERLGSSEGVPRLFGATVHEARRIEQAGKGIRNAQGDVIVMVSRATLQLAEFELAARFGKSYAASFHRSLGLNGSVIPGNGIQPTALESFAVPIDTRVIALLLRGRDLC